MKAAAFVILPCRYSQKVFCIARSASQKVLFFHHKVITFNMHKSRITFAQSKPFLLHNENVKLNMRIESHNFYNHDTRTAYYIA